MMRNTLLFDPTLRTSIQHNTEDIHVARLVDYILQRLWELCDYNSVGLRLQFSWLANKQDNFQADASKRQ